MPPEGISSSRCGSLGWREKEILVAFTSHPAVVQADVFTVWTFLKAPLDVRVGSDQLGVYMLHTIRPLSVGH